MATRDPPETAERVPGALCRPNSRRTELYLAWLVHEDGRAVWLAEWVEHDDSGRDGPPGHLPLATPLPAPPARPVGSAEALAEALAARFQAHPLANQTTAATAYAEEALAAGADPCEVIRTSLRWAAPGGVARGFGAALSARGAGAYRDGVDLAALRRLARASLVLELTCLDGHSEVYGARCSRATEPLLADAPAVRYPAGKHPGHDGGDHEAVVREYDRLLTGYFREAQRLVDHALALPPERLEASYPVSTPSARKTAEEAVAAVRAALADAPERHLATAVWELTGQPLAAIQPALAEALAARTPPDASAATVREAAAVTARGRFVTTALRALLESDQDLDAIHRARDEEWARRDADDAVRRAELAAREARLGRRIERALDAVLAALLRATLWAFPLVIVIVFALFTLLLRACLHPPARGCDPRISARYSARWTPR